MVDFTKNPADCTPAERWARFDAVLAEIFVEAWEAGKLPTPAPVSVDVVAA